MAQRLIKRGHLVILQGLLAHEGPAYALRALAAAARDERARQEMKKPPQLSAARRMKHLARALEQLARLVKDDSEAEVEPESRSKKKDRT